ncbi:MAG: DUF599 domain-containing protein [Arenicella sp.]
MTFIKLIMNWDMLELAQQHWDDILAFLVFLLCWTGYSRYAVAKAKVQPALSSMLHKHRQQWMLRVIARKHDTRSPDMIGLGTLERSVSFFASTSLIVIAGLLTLLGATEEVTAVLASLSFVVEQSLLVIEIKVLFLILMFVYGFFKFCWAMRCYSFLVIMLGGVPEMTPDNYDQEQVDNWSNRAANVLSGAAHHFNLGLRTYYFALAVLAWFIGPWYFVVASILVVAVLYRRDFKSAVLESLRVLD